VKDHLFFGSRQEAKAYWRNGRKKLVRRLKKKIQKRITTEYEPHRLLTRNEGRSKERGLRTMTEPRQKGGTEGTSRGSAMVKREIIKPKETKKRHIGGESVGV